MNEVLEKTIKTMDQNNQNLDNNKTYIKDGLKHCSVCDKAIETYLIIPWTNEKRKVGCICKCRVEELEREKKEEIQRKNKMRIDKLQKDSLLGERYKNATFEKSLKGVNGDFDKAFIRCKKYCEVSSKVLEDGLGIYIYGDRGTGKTHLTACMVNELVRQGRGVLFTNFFEISKMIRNIYGGANTSELSFINQIANIDFLFIDDIGSEVLRKNDQDTWLQGIMFDVINKRYNNKKPTVFTSNHSLQELNRKRGVQGKTVDRMLEMSHLILKVEGASYRQEKRKMELPF